MTTPSNHLAFKLSVPLLVLLGCGPRGEELLGGDAGDAGTEANSDAGTITCEPACADTEQCTDGICVAIDCPDCRAACSDGLDNDADGWADGDDPDCVTEDSDELGWGTTTCNDGLDNDGDTRADREDPDCASASSDEVLGDGPCADECRFDARAEGRHCQLWDATLSQWSDGLDSGAGQLHNRARDYTRWLRERLLPVGGVMRGYFTDATFTDVFLYAGTRDSPIWTGIYLASEAMRWAETGSVDARAQVESTIHVLDRWWRISGDRGYLARYAAPADSPAPVDAIFDADDPENHRDVAFEGGSWHWKGNVSRDQYQGAFFGYAMAYDLIADEGLRAIIRANIVATVEQLMQRQTRTMALTIDGIPLTVEMELQHVIYTDDETPNGAPGMDITTSPFDTGDKGLLVFWPNPAEHLRQISLLSWLPDIFLRTQAVQLGGMFAVALHVTAGVPAYAERRGAIQAHYDSFFPEWLEMASSWANSNECGSSYHGLNIAFLPAFNWVRLEADPSRRAALEARVLRESLWDAVHDHKNVFFAYIYASQASQDATGVVSAHSEQLRQFPAPPNISIAVDNRGAYPEDPACEGQSSIAIDVADRIPTSFLWERNPWKLVGDPEPNKLYPGVDYLVTYWMARRFGYLADDAANTCLQWRD